MAHDESMNDCILFGPSRVLHAWRWRSLCFWEVTSLLRAIITGVSLGFGLDIFLLPVFGSDLHPAFLLLYNGDDILAGGLGSV